MILFHKIVKLLMLFFIVINLEIHHSCGAVHKNKIKRSFDSFMERNYDSNSNSFTNFYNQGRKINNRNNNINMALEKLINETNPQTDEKCISKNKNHQGKNNKINSFYKYFNIEQLNCFNDYNENYLNFLSGYNLDKLSDIYYNVSNFLMENQLHASSGREDYENLGELNNFGTIKEKISRLSDEMEDSYMDEETNESDKRLNSNTNDMIHGGDLYDDNESKNHFNTIENQKVVSTEKYMSKFNNDLIPLKIDNCRIREMTDLKEKQSLDNVAENVFKNGEINFVKEVGNNNYNKEKITNVKNIANKQSNDLLAKQINSFKFFNNLKKFTEIPQTFSVSLKRPNVLNYRGKRNYNLKNINSNFKIISKNSSRRYTFPFKLTNFISSAKTDAEENYPNKQICMLHKKKFTRKEFNKFKKIKRENNNFNKSNFENYLEVNKLPWKRETFENSLNQFCSNNADKSQYGINTVFGKTNNLLDLLNFLDGDVNEKTISNFPNSKKRNIKEINSLKKSLIEEEITEKNLQKNMTCEPDRNLITVTPNKNRGRGYNSSGYEDAGGWTPPDPNIPTEYSEPTVETECHKTKINKCHIIYHDPSPCNTCPSTKSTTSSDIHDILC